MQYALLNRFQAAFLGAVIGETIGLEFLQAAEPASREAGQVASVIRLNPSSGKQLHLERLTRFYTDSLLQPGRIEDPNDAIFQEPLDTAEAAIALLPVFLFFHEDFSKLRQNLEATISLWWTANVSQADLLAIGYTIAQALLENLDPLRVISQYLNSMNPPTEGVSQFQKLTQVEEFVWQNIGLEDVLQTLSGRTMRGELAIALSMYCFLSTPGDFRLSVLRAARAGDQVPGVSIPVLCALTGALSGAHNSLIGIPLEWRFGMTQWESIEAGELTQTELLHRATQLFEQWSGVLDPATVLTDMHRSPIVAAPQVIRKLPS